MSGNNTHEGEESEKLGGDFLFSQEDLQRIIIGLEAQEATLLFKIY
jgi:hypothetical protein